MPEPERPVPPPLPKLLPWLLLMCLAANLLPIWTVQWLPMGDLYGHVQLMDIVLRYGDPATVYRDIYLLPQSLDPNTLSLWFARMVPGMNALLAARVLMSAYVVGLPLSMLWLARTMRRSPWLAFLSLPMTWNALVAIGFVNYLLALPVLFCVLALARGYAEFGRPWRGILLALSLVLMFFCHVIAFLIALGMAAFLLIWHGEGRHRLTRLWVIAAASPIGAQWVWRKFIALEATAQGRTFGTQSGNLGLAFLPRKELIGQMYEWTFQYFRDGVDHKMAWSLLAVWLVLLVVGLVQQLRGSADAKPRWRDRSLELMTLLCAVAYFFLPSHMNEMSIITERILLQTALLLTLWPQLSFQGWQRLLVVPIVVLALGYSWTVREEFRRFARDDVGNLDGALRDLPAKSLFCYILAERENDTTYMNSLWHLPRAIFAVQHGGLVDNSFAVRPYTPVQYKAGAAPVELIGEFWQNPHLFDYDHVLVRATTLLNEAERSPYLQRVWHEGHFWLYRVKREVRALVETTQVGGTGGTPEFSDCPRGSALTGLVVQHKEGTAVEDPGTIIHNLTPICSRLSRPPFPYLDAALQYLKSTQALPAAAPAKPRPFGIFRRAESAPEPSGNATEARRLGLATAGTTVERLLCPAETVVTGVTGRSGRYANSIGLLCGPMTWRGDAAGLTATPVAGGSAGGVYRMQCHPGQIVVGMQGNFGWLADAVGIACADWMVW